MGDELGAVLRAGVERGAVPGATAVIVDRDGVRAEAGAGERMIGSGVDMTVDTVGAIFSLTKAVTSAAAMQLVERGELELDVPAGSVCSELGDVEVLDGFSDDGTPITRPPERALTLRHLLTHTSGFVYGDIWNADCGRWMEATGSPSLFTRKKSSLRTPLMFDPGEQWEYGIGIDWVGQMIEATSGTTLGEFFSEHLFGPLGMNDTGFTHTESMLERAAAVHARLPDGSLVPIDLPAPEAPEFEMGGAGLHSTMPDYGRFIRMILRGGELDGERVLGSDTVDTMCGNHIGDLRIGALPTANPQFSNDVDLYPDVGKTWGLAFMINEAPLDTGRPAGGLAWAGLANSYYWIDRTNGIGGAYLSQILPFADPGSMGLFAEVERSAYDSLSVAAG